MNQDWLFTTNENICSLRVAGVMVCGDKILVQRDLYGQEFALPGGHVKINETLESALVREFQEEMQLDIKCIRLLWTEECFWNWNKKNAHTITFYFLIDAEEGVCITPNESFVPHKDNSNVVVGWLDKSDIQSVVIYPYFLKEEITNLGNTVKHFVSR